MKRWAWILLLLSLGLNIGLGIGVLGDRRDRGPRGHDLHSGDDGDDSERRGRFGSRRWGGARGRGGRPAMGDSAAWREFAEHRYERLADHLELAGEQRDHFAATHREGARRVRGQGLRVHEARQRLHDLYRGEPLEETAVRAAVAELAGAQAQMDSLVAEVLMAELELLDPRQRERYLDLIPWEQRHNDAGTQGHGHGKHR